MATLGHSGSRVDKSQKRSKSHLNYITLRYPTFLVTCFLSFYHVGIYYVLCSFLKILYYFINCFFIHPIDDI